MERRMKIEVECYAGSKADERPLRIFLGDQKYELEEVLDQGYGPEHTFFKVRAEDGHLYILRHTTPPQDEWELISFRQV
jgi:hypothetical protein